MALSVTHALNAASFALEPKRVIIQSAAITSARVMLIAFASLVPRIFIVVSFERKPKSATVTPQIAYPHDINMRLFPILSEITPAKSVATVATTPLS